MERMTRKKLEREARKRDILETALVLFAEKDFHEVTVDEIAERVGLSKGTLYLYFENKEHLFFSIIQDKTDALFNSLQTSIQREAPFLECLKDFIHSYLAFFEEHKHYFKIIHCEKSRMDEHYADRLKAHMIKSFDDFEELILILIAKGQEENVLRALRPDLITKSLRGLLNAFTFQSIFMNNEYSLVDETPHVFDLFLYGVKAIDA